MNPPDMILTKILGEIRFLRYRWLLAVAGFVLIAILTPLCLLALLDWRMPLQESLVFYLAGGSLLLSFSVLFFLRRRLAVWLPRPSVRSLTLFLEQNKPELMDSLICAVELLQNPERTSAFRQDLLDQVEQKLTQLNLHTMTRQQAFSLSTLLLLFTLAGSGVLLFSISPISHKIRDYTADLLKGQQTGLQVQPGTAEIAYGDDLSVTARIHRGPQQAKIRIHDANGVQEYDMYTDGSRQRFEVYGVTAPFTYSIRTPTLHSPSFTVKTFTKPVIQRCKIRIQPPDYTHLPPKTEQNLNDLSVPAGSQVEWTLETNIPVTASLAKTKGKSHVFQASTPRKFQWKSRISQSFRYRIILQDKKGRKIETNRTYAVECIEDFPPLIHVSAPEEDAQIRPDELLLLAARITDDYGVQKADFFYSINGDEWQSKPLFRRKKARAKTQIDCMDAIDLNTCNLKPGDVITAYFQAEDQAEPEANKTQTEIQFIEIRADKANSKKGKGGGKKKSLRISDLIMEQKQVIRTTWKLTRRQDRAERERTLREAKKMAGDLRVTAQKRYNDLKKSVGGHFGPLDVLFSAALEQMEKAQLRLEKNLPNASLPHQQKSLSHLIALEIELLKNSSACKKGKQGNATKPPPPDRQEQQKKQEAAKKMLTQIQQNIRDLEQLENQQQTLNTDIKQAAANRRKKDYTQYLNRRQQEINRQTNTIQQTLREMPSANPARTELQRASSEMEQTSTSLNQNQLHNAAKHGITAATFIRRSLEQLKQLRDAFGDNQISRAMKQLKKLRSQQQALQQATRKQPRRLSKDTAKQLGMQQRQLRQQAENLLKQMENAAAALEQKNPGASRELKKGLQKAQKDGLTRSMKRTENALRYQRRDPTVKSQQKNLDILQSLASSLKQAQLQRPKPGADALRRMLSEVIKQMKAYQKTAPNSRQRTAIQKQAAKTMEQMAERLNDSTMQQLADAMARQAQTQPAPANDLRTRSLFAKAARLLENRLLAQHVQHQIDLSRISGCRAPDKYRKLVSQYFKNLSREE